jgi:hypothetical protein
MKKSSIHNNDIKNRQEIKDTHIYKSKILRFRKHIGQIIRERIPLLSPLRDVIYQKWMISETRIPRWSLWRRWRIIIIITESIILWMLLLNSHELYNEAEHNLRIILFHHDRPHHISIKIKIIMICITIGTGIYYLIVKPWDLQEAIKE